MLNPSRNSVAGWLFAVAVIALGLAPLANLNDGVMIAVINAKFAMLVVATFLARFGRGPSAAWWFGFATLGWTSVLIGVPELWEGINSVKMAPGLYLGDVAGSIADRLASAMKPPIGTVHAAQVEHFEKVQHVVSTWITILASIAGGSLALLIDRRAGRSAAADTPEPTPSR